MKRKIQILDNYSSTISNIITFYGSRFLKNLILTTILLFAIFVIPVNGADSLWVHNLKDSVVVIANRYQISMKNISNSYEVIPSWQVKALSNHSALELVDISYPSAFVMDKKIMGYGVGTGGAGQIYLRGQGGQPNTGVLVLLNGHPDFMGIFGHPLPDVYGMDNVRQVEIIAGPNSTVFGSQAMGGVINIVSEPDYGNLMQFSAEAGNFNTFKLGLNLAKQFGNNGLFFTLRKKQTDGHIDNTSFESIHLQAGWNYQISNAWHLSVQGRYVPYSFDDPERAGLEDVANLGTYAKIKRATGEIILKNSLDKVQGSTQIYTNLGEHKFYDGFESNDYTIGLSSYQNWLYSKNLSFAGGIDLIQYGGKAKNDYTTLPNGKPVVNPDRHELTSVGIYFLGFYSPYQLISIKGGLRYQYNTLPLNQISPVIGLTLNMHASLKLFATYQNGFRSPTLMELYLFPSSNDNLEEETINSFETGAMFTWGNNNSVRIAFYKNDVENMIQSLPHNPIPPTYQFQNSGKANQWGIESQFKYHLTRNMGFQLGYSYLDPDELTAFNPNHQFKYMFFGKYKYLSFNIYGKYVEGLFAENKSEEALPDYHILNFSLSINFEPAELYLKLLNALDRKYYAQPEYLAPGMLVRIGTVIKL